MATKKQIAEQAMRIISGGHLKPDRTVTIREVMLHLDQLRDARCRLDTLNNVKAGNYSVSEDYLSIVTGTVSSGTVDLPQPALDLQWGLGLYQVGPTSDLEEAYGIVPPGGVALLKGTAALERASKGYCWLVAGTIYFKNVTDTTGVTIWYVPSSKSIAEDADYPVPPDVEAELLQQLVQMFGIQKEVPHDELEDGQK
ncbi:MAG: hypothetical protein ACYTBJ_13500 [Planctomycetota bacterium]|jgi:hypothetical protein